MHSIIASSGASIIISFSMHTLELVLFTLHSFHHSRISSLINSFSTVIMATRPFDLLVYGATGFTGKKVAQYAIEQHPDLSIAIAGRNESKLLTVADQLGLPPSSSFVASLEDDGSGSGTNDELINTVRKARVILACAGPFRQCGMPLVKAAVQAKTDYLDLCGEPQFFDDTLVECEEDARKNNVLVVSACAFDCVPADLSASLVAREVRKRFATDGGEDGGSVGGDAVVSGIEICHTFGGVAKANATTFHAAVDGFYAGHSGDLKKSRQKVEEKFRVEKPPQRPPEWPKVPQQPGNLPVFHHDSETYSMKFPGADAAAIFGSWRYLRLREPEKYGKIPQPRLSVCFGCPDKVTSMKVLSFGAVFASLARYRFGVDLLHRYPEVFTNGVFVQGGPSQEELERGTFRTYSTGYGRSKDEIVRATCDGPEPGYVATPKMLVALALTVLKHRENLAFAGGVTLPGALFGECQEVYDILKESGVVFNVEEATVENS